MASTSEPASTVKLLPMDAKPPKSKSFPYYTIHPLWQDVVPIPQADQTGTLAAIRYWPRYSEAMSYLRAMMAENEISERALALTEDLIEMNPAHYTVWIYRMNVLRGLWSAVGRPKVENESVGSTESSRFEKLLRDVKAELKWLDEVSFRNLKNYQIWHHRHALIDLLPEDPAGKPFDTNPAPSAQAQASSSTGTETWGFHNIEETAAAVQASTVDSHAINHELSDLITSEQTFLAQILSLDTKNYHVWSYRQWLCMRYPTYLLPFYGTNISSVKDTSTTSTTTPSTKDILSSIASTYRSHSEVQAMDILIADDVRNNSAWSHRYFILSGHHELRFSQTHNVVLKTVNEDQLLRTHELLDMELVDAEIAYTQTEIRKAPMNGSSWNYLRGVLGHGGQEVGSVKVFCEEFLGPNRDLWTDQYAELKKEDDNAKDGSDRQREEVGVRSAKAIEWLSEIYAQEGTEEGRRRARECLRSLAEKWDVIRKGYWNYLGEKMEEEWKREATVIS